MLSTQQRDRIIYRMCASSVDLPDDPCHRIFAQDPQGKYKAYAWVFLSFLSPDHPLILT